MNHSSFSFHFHLLTIYSDLADTFPNGEFAQNYRQDWVMAMVRAVRSNRDHTDRTINTARWAREQVRRQTSTQAQ